MSGPGDGRDTYSQRAKSIVFGIFIQAEEGQRFRGEPEKVLYDILSQEKENPLIRKDIHFDTILGYSPTLSELLNTLIIGGIVRGSGWPMVEFEVLRLPYLKKIVDEEGFNGNQRKYLRGLGQRLVEKYSIPDETAG